LYFTNRPYIIIKINYNADDFLFAKNMKRTHIKNLHTQLGNTVTINCWIDVARDQGKMAFFDFRDASGKVQGVVFGKPEVLDIAKTLRPEWVVAITGVVNDRTDKNAKEFKVQFEETGKRDFSVKDVEIEVTEINVLTKKFD
jgi:aspartyl-tRNA synthetase